VLTPSADAFAALARSSPWRWSTMRFTVSWPGDRYRPQALRAWLRRPDALRVETVDGEFRQVVHEQRSTVAVMSFPPTAETHRRYPWPTDGAAPFPELRPDGLVRVRPRHLSYDAPLYRDYSWVAMLDPVEFADGAAPDTDAAPLRMGEVRDVEHGGRPAWEAVAEPLSAYEPRCGCCPLLRSREVDLDEWDGQNLLDAYPEAYRVRLDVQTGVCVLTEAIGGAVSGAGHDLRIEAVDDPLDDDLFREPRRGWFR
jgi:hypothetical protein